jgi:hypothetical protein
MAGVVFIRSLLSGVAVDLNSCVVDMSGSGGRYAMIDMFAGRL